MGTSMPSHMHDINMTEYLFVQWYNEDQIDTFQYEAQFVFDHEQALEFVRQFRWEDNSVYYLRDLLQDMDDQALHIFRMTDKEVETRIAEMLSLGQIKAYSQIPVENDGDDFEYAEEALTAEASKVAANDKRAIRKPEAHKAAPPQLTWFDIELVDKNEKPRAGEKYIVKRGDEIIKQGNLNSYGKANVSQIEKGEYKVCFPNIDKDKWLTTKPKSKSGGGK